MKRRRREGELSDDGYEKKDSNVRPRKRRKKSKKKLKSTFLNVNTVLCECICNRKDQIKRELSEFKEEHSKLRLKKNQYAMQYVMKRLKTHMRLAQNKKTSIDRLSRLLNYRNRLSKKEVLKTLDYNCREYHILRQETMKELDYSQDKFRQTEEEFRQSAKNKLFKKRDMNFIILRKELSSLSVYLLKNVTSRFEIKENRKPRLKNDHINWIVNKIEQIRTFNGRKYFEQNPTEIGKTVYPTDVKSKFPGEVSRIIFQYLQRCRKVLDNVGLVNHWFHTCLLLMWGHLDLSTSNSWKIPDILWLSITSVKIKYCNFLKEQRYVFGKLRKSKNLIAMYNLDHHRCLEEYSFPSVKICEFYTVTLYSNFNIEDHLHHVFPNIETLHLNYRSVCFTQNFFKRLKKLNHIIIETWGNRTFEKGDEVKEARLLRELNQTGRYKIDIYNSSNEIKNITKNQTYKMKPFSEIIGKIITAGGLFKYKPDLD